MEYLYFLLYGAATEGASTASQTSRAGTTSDVTAGYHDDRHRLGHTDLTPIVHILRLMCGSIFAGMPIKKFKMIIDRLLSPKQWR